MPIALRVPGLALAALVAAAGLTGCTGTQAVDAAQVRTPALKTVDAGPSGLFQASDRAPSPTIAGTTLDGAHLDVASLRGKVVVVNFWAAWCVPCEKEMPLLEETWRRYRSRDVAFVGVNTNDFSGDARRFVDRYNVTFPIVRDANGRVLARYGGLPIPWTYFIGTDGRIASYIRGQVREEELERGIEDARRA